MKQLIKQEGKYSLYKVEYTTRFNGCQCFKDCDCMEDWKRQGNPKRVTEYTLFDGKRTRRYRTIDDALLMMKRIENGYLKVNTDENN